MYPAQGSVIRAITYVFLFLSMCSGIHCGGSNNNQSQNIDNFSGEYSLINHNCSVILPPNGIRVTQSGTSVTLIILQAPFGSFLTEGDRFEGTLSFENDVWVADLEDTTGCAAVKINDERDISVARQEYNVSTSFDDLLALCQDLSLDGQCALVFRPE